MKVYHQREQSPLDLTFVNSSYPRELGTSAICMFIRTWGKITKAIIGSVVGGEFLREMSKDKRNSLNSVLANWGHPSDWMWLRSRPPNSQKMVLRRRWQWWRSQGEAGKQLGGPSTCRPWPADPSRGKGCCPTPPGRRWWNKMGEAKSMIGWAEQSCTHLLKNDGPWPL